MAVSLLVLREGAPHYIHGQLVRVTSLEALQRKNSFPEEKFISKPVLDLLRVYQVTCLSQELLLSESDLLQCRQKWETPLRIGHCPKGHRPLLL